MTPEKFIAWRVAFGGRRFLLTLGAAVINTWLLISERLDSAAYVTLTLGTVAAYITGATAQKFSKGSEHD